MDLSGESAEGSAGELAGLRASGGPVGLVNQFSAHRPAAHTPCCTARGRPKWAMLTSGFRRHVVWQVVMLDSSACGLLPEATLVGRRRSRQAVPALRTVGEHGLLAVTQHSHSRVCPFIHHKRRSVALAFRCLSKVPATAVCIGKCIAACGLLVGQVSSRLASTLSTL